MEHQSFIDWMKAVGMLLIVTGHVFGDPYHVFNSVSQPIYTKQLGVAFFVFITGWSLGNETRSGFRVVFNRVFPVYFYGILFAMLLSSIYFFTGNDINESNYIPFFGGINVFLNYFPANPTTWYIGTYLHLLLFWYYFLQGKQLEKKHILLAFVTENIARCTLIFFNFEFIAYMMLPNWLTVFLLGMYLHKSRDTRFKATTTTLLFIWLLTLFFWSNQNLTPSFDNSFPFRMLLMNEAYELPLRSLLISAIYLINTLIVFHVARSLPHQKIVSFFARNTLIIFITHMPIIYSISYYIYSLYEILWIGNVILILLLYVGIAIISELTQKSININYLRNNSWDIVQRFSK